jgi:isoleucyl-tRNA synthetase
MMSDTADDMRIGPEILKQQAELYRRLRNTLRWVLGSLAGYTEAEAVPVAEMPELERYILHRMTEIDAKIRAAVDSYDWAGVYPEVHNFCATDLSAFYFDIRKDAVYCDRPDSLRRRAARTVLDHLHRCLCTWLAPVLCFTAEEAWTARFGDQDSVHLHLFPVLPEYWRDEALAEKWNVIRNIRRTATGRLEVMRANNEIRSSLQARIKLGLAEPERSYLTADEWAELFIVSEVGLLPFDELQSRTDTNGNAAPDALPHVQLDADQAPGRKCDRCWRVLTEVGASAVHPTLCLRCTDAVEAL